MATTPRLVREVPKPREDVAAGSWDDDRLVHQPSGGPVPSRLGRFLIRSILGSGTSATVYRAYDATLERELALKVLHPSLSGTRSESRLLAEAKALARIRHPRVVTVYETGRFGRVPYLATALVSGRTLARLIQDGPLDARRAATIAAEVADALGHVHDRGIIHRDIKPANILLDESGDVHLADFGLARFGAEDSNRTLAGAVLGTPIYLAPELTEGQDSAPSPACDQYSLGITLYELLCGRPPFLGPPATVLYRALHEDPPAPRTLNARIPAALERLTLQAMARRPDDRFASCQALSDALRRWLATEESELRRLGPWRVASGW